MKDVKIDISSTGFPSQFVSDSEKNSVEFGLQVGQAIQYEWFRKDGAQCRFYTNGKTSIDLAYMRGESSLLLNTKRTRH